jgi:hypothetical protein
VLLLKATTMLRHLPRLVLIPVPWRLTSNSQCRGLHTLPLFISTLHGVRIRYHIKKWHGVFLDVHPILRDKSTLSMSTDYRRSSILDNVDITYMIMCFKVTRLVLPWALLLSHCTRRVL